jgi:dynein intermediate chain 4, axonemal
MPPKKGKSKYARSSRLSQNSSKNAEAAKQAKIRVIVNGVDVTPKSLLPPEYRAAAAATLGDPNSSKTFMGDLSMQSFGFQEQSGGPQVGDESTAATGTVGTEASSIGAGMAKMNLEVKQEEKDAVADLFAEDEDELGAGKQYLSEAEKNKLVEICLAETPTVNLLTIRGICVMNETDEFTNVTAQNEAYAALLSSKATSDNFSERAAQTFNFDPKNKEVMATPVMTQDIGCDATTWDIYDAMKQFDPTTTFSDDEEAENRRGSVSEMPRDVEAEKRVEEIVAATLATEGCLLPIDTGAVAASTKAPAATDGYYDASNSTDIVAAREAKTILSSNTLLKSLELCEAAISQNVFHEKHLLYRDVPDITKILEAFEAKEANQEDEDSVLGDDEVVEEKPSMVWLWSFKSSVTVGRNVSGMKFNPVNGDLLAVSYGQYEFSLERKDGLVCLWSLKNPMWPQLVISSSSGATSLDWSNKYPNLLAVGHYDGSIIVYDITGDGATALLDSTQLPTKHTDAVWDIKWVDKGAEQGESLVSISTDGRVTEWSIKKGLASSDLMVLKRITNEFFKDVGNTSIGTVAVDGNDKKKGKRGRKGDDGGDDGAKMQSDGIISRRASGLCFDFHKNDSSTYMVGTEDGILHRCSVSYNEQYLDNYFGHAGPVYRVRFSPFSSNIFMSCSADWTIKVWHTTKVGGEQRHILAFQPGDLTDHVSDIRWSPKDANVFGSVTGDGRIQIWNLTKMDPQITLWVDPDFTDEEKASFAAAESELEDQKNKKAEKEKQANDPLAMLALTMKRKKEGIVEEEVEEEFDIQGAEDKIRKDKNLYKSLTCIEFSNNAPVIVVGSADGTVGCYRLNGLDILPLSDKEQLDRLESSMFDALSMNEDAQGAH